MPWILAVAGILLLYCGFWFVLMKLISPLAREIEGAATLFVISGFLWMVAVFILSGGNASMTILTAVVQFGVVRPYLLLRLRTQ